MTKLSPERLMVSILNRVRQDYRKLYPLDTLNNQRLTTLLHSAAWKVKEKEEEADPQHIRVSQ